MKHKRLFKIMAYIEDIIAFLLCTCLFIYVIGEPVGEYTFKVFILKILALFGIYLIAKIEGD